MDSNEYYNFVKTELAKRENLLASLETQFAELVDEHVNSKKISNNKAPQLLANLAAYEKELNKKKRKLELEITEVKALIIKAKERLEIALEEINHG